MILSWVQYLTSDFFLKLICAASLSSCGFQIFISVCNRVPQVHIFVDMALWHAFCSLLFLLILMISSCSFLCSAGFTRQFSVSLSTPEPPFLLLVFQRSGQTRTLSSWNFLTLYPTLHLSLYSSKFTWSAVFLITPALDCSIFIQFLWLFFFFSSESTGRYAPFSINTNSGWMTLVWVLKDVNTMGVMGLLVCPHPLSFVSVLKHGHLYPRLAST